MKYVEKDFSDLNPGTICIYDGNYVITLCFTQKVILNRWGKKEIISYFRYKKLLSPYVNEPIDPQDHYYHNCAYKTSYDDKYNNFHFIIILEDHEVTDIYKEYRDKYINNPKVQKKLLKYNNE